MNRWRKSSYSNGGGGGSCVEVEQTLTGLRDSKNPTGPELRFKSRGALAGLLAAIKRGEL